MLKPKESVMTKTDLYKTAPRLYVQNSLHPGKEVVLYGAQAHYLINVMRAPKGAYIRLFNGVDGEWVGTVEGVTKRDISIHLKEKTHQQEVLPSVALFFSPIRKHRQDFLIEKATELGVTALHPILMHHTQIKAIKKDKVEAQVVEASEQSERLTVPDVHALISFKEMLASWPKDALLHVGCARQRCPSLMSIAQKKSVSAILIGPEGGFSEAELKLLAAAPFVRFFSLGRGVLRAETAALSALSFLKGCRAEES